MSELETTYSNEELRLRPKSLPLLQRISRSLVLQRFAKMELGNLIWIDEFGRYEFGEQANSECAATVTVISTEFYHRVATGGAVSGAEAYMDGLWSCDDLTQLVRLLVINRSVLDNLDKGLARLALPLRRIMHRFSNNTKAGSRRNIAAHYDLGNEFFRLWLDDTMMYSSAIFERAEMSLREASQAKLERICEKLSLNAEDHVLEIGTGWGGFAIHAASRYGCKVTTTTISREQYEYATALVNNAGLSKQVTVLQQEKYVFI